MLITVDNSFMWRGYNTLIMSRKKNQMSMVRRQTFMGQYSIIKRQTLELKVYFTHGQ